MSTLIASNSSEQIQAEPSFAKDSLNSTGFVRCRVIRYKSHAHETPEPIIELYDGDLLHFSKLDNAMFRAVNVTLEPSAGEYTIGPIDLGKGTEEWLLSTSPETYLDLPEYFIDIPEKSDSNTDYSEMITTDSLLALHGTCIIKEVLQGFQDLQLNLPNQADEILMQPALLQNIDTQSLFTSIDNAILPENSDVISPAEMPSQSDQAEPLLVNANVDLLVSYMAEGRNVADSVSVHSREHTLYSGSILAVNQSVN